MGFQQREELSFNEQASLLKCERLTHSVGSSMMATNPFNWIAPESQKRAFWFLSLLTVLLLITLRTLDAPLVNETAPSGIVSFELAGQLATARAIMEAWGPRGQLYAGVSPRLDSPFLISYASAIGLGCILISAYLAKRTTFISRLSVWIAWGLVMAAVLDALENYALIRLLFGSQDFLWPIVAQWSAIPKFLRCSPSA
jgi:hypothetical protein